MTFICATCNHNKSQHRYDLMPFTGTRNTSCKHQNRDIAGSHCPCREYQGETNDTDRI